jgi:hypothetical protein
VVHTDGNRDLYQIDFLPSSMELVNKTRLTHKPEYIIVLFIVIIGLSSAVVLYNNDNLSLLYYGDSISHLVRSREFVDSTNPGLFEQLGTVWLPLPHLLLMPFTLIEPLFRTGFAGLMISLPSLAISSVFIFKIIRLQSISSLVALVSALIYALNPNMIYLAITPMTETLFMLFFVASGYFFLRWIYGSSKYLKIKNQGDDEKILSQTFLDMHPSFNLLLSSIFVSLSTLCRYEGWILAFFLVSFVTISVLRKTSYSIRGDKIGIILISILSLSGIALWLIWNAYAYGDPLEFANAPYFSAASHAFGGTIRATLYLQPWNVASIFSITAFAMYGPVLLIAAMIGYYLHRHFGKSEDRRKRRNLYLFLAMPPIFIIISLLIGIGEMSQFGWENSRYLIVLSPLLVSLSSLLLVRLFSKFNKRYLPLLGIIIIFFSYHFALPALGVVTFLNANYQFSADRQSQINLAESLKSIYDRNSTILILTGSSQHNKIMQLSNIPLKQFNQIQESGADKESFKKPWLHTKYLILGKKPDASAKNVTQYWLDRQPLLEKYFNTVYDDKYYKLMVLSPSYSPKEPKSLQNFVTHLNVTVDGKPLIVPANIGIDPSLHNDHSLDLYGRQKSPLYTQSDTGTIHVESKIITNYTLGEFLDIWGIDLGGKIVNMTASGKNIANYREQVLSDKEKINLRVCTNDYILRSRTC